MGRHGADDAHRAFIQQKFCHQAVKAVARRHFPQLLIALFGQERLHRVAAVKPRIKRMDAAEQPRRFARLAGRKLAAVDGGSQRVLVQPGFNQLLHGVADHLAQFLLTAIGNVAQSQHHVRLRHRVVQRHAYILTLARRQQRLLQRRVVAARQHIKEDFRRRDAHRIRPRRDNLRQRQHGLVGSILLGADFIRLFRFGGEGLLHGDFVLLVQAVKAAQVLLRQRQHLVQRNRAIQINARIRRVIIAAVHAQELLIGQVGNMLRVAAGIPAIAVIREEDVQRLLINQLIHVAHGALHLVEHNALVQRRAVFVQLDVPAFLIEDVRVLQDARREHSVQIHLRQVQEILLVAAGHGVNRLVGEGHRVQERRHAALHQLDERFTDRILGTAAEDGMLQNVEYTGRILRQGLKRDAERLVVLAVIHPNQLCAGLFVVHFHHLPVQFFAFAHAVNTKAVTRRSFVQIHHGELLSL